MPLFHRLGQPLHPGEIVLEIAGPKAGRDAIGTDRCLFASVGIAAYLTPPLVLAFGPMEAASARAHRISAPWDTREVVNQLGNASPAELVDRWSVSAPDDEVFLASYLAHCFESLTAWLDGQRPSGQDVVGVLNALNREVARSGVDDVDRRLRLTTPEARYTENLDLSGELLLAAFVDVNHAVGTPAEREWARTYDTLEMLLHDDLYRLRRSIGITDLRAVARDYVREILRVEQLL